MNDHQEIVIILIVGTAGMVFLAFSVVFFVLLYQRKLQKRKIEFQEIEELLKKQELNATYRLLQAQENERKRLARELHDNLGSILVTANMYIDTLAINPNQSAEKIGKVSELIQTATAETRKISHSLNSGLLQHFGLAPTLHDLVKTLNDTGKLSVQLRLDISDQCLDQEKSVEIYRIIQELMNNTLKHAKASLIELEVIEHKNNYIGIQFIDNGIGFDSENIQVKGIGLKNIESRLEKLKGRISYHSKPGQGVRIKLEIPL
jgi:two-component system, NarL family, sensor kinase